MSAPTEAHSLGQSTYPTNPQDRSSVGSGVYGDPVIPPSHNARTVVLCFDGTGDQFGGDVCVHSSSWYLSLNLACRTRTSCSSSRCSRRTIRASRWSTIRSAKADFCPSETTIKTRHFSLELGRTRSRRSRARSGQSCTS
jgi:hypothetical protein